MNKVFAIFAFVLFTATVGYCQETFRVEDANCSFEIPDSWELVVEIGNLKDRKIIQHFFIDNNIDSRFKSSYGDEYNAYFSNEVSPKRVEKRTEAKWVSVSTEPKKQEFLNKSFEFLLKKMKKHQGNWDRAKLASADCYYDADRHVYYESIVLYKPNKPEAGSLIEFHAIFLGSSRETVLKFLWETDDPDGFLDYAYSIADSFSYDDGYGFGEGSDGVTLDLETVSRSPHFWLLPTIGLFVVIFIIRKWAAS